MRVVQVVEVVADDGGVPAAGVVGNPVHPGGLEPVVEVLFTVVVAGLGEGGVTGVVGNHHCPWHCSTMLKLLKITRIPTYLEIGMMTFKLSFISAIACTDLILRAVSEQANCFTDEVNNVLTSSRICCLILSSRKSFISTL